MVAPFGCVLQRYKDEVAPWFRFSFPSISPKIKPLLKLLAMGGERDSLCASDLLIPIRKDSSRHSGLTHDKGRCSYVVVKGRSRHLEKKSAKRGSAALGAKVGKSASEN